jgi:hypothetical protein
VRGQRLELRGFGAFITKRRSARIGRNPRTGEEVPVDAKAVPYFRAGKELHARLNRGLAAGKAGHERPQRSYCDHPLPTAQEALSEPFAAFPSWFLSMARLSRLASAGAALPRTVRYEPLQDARPGRLRIPAAASISACCRRWSQPRATPEAKGLLAPYGCLKRVTKPAEPFT